MAVAGLVVATAASAQSEAAGKIAYDPATHLISIACDDVPLGAVLKQVALKTGLTITSAKAVFDGRVSLAFDRVPLDHALKQLLEGYSSTFLYDLGRDPAGAVPGEDRTPRLARVIVLGRKTAREPADHQATVAPEPTDTLDALIAGRPAAARAALAALREPSSERERIVRALLERLDNGSLVPPDGVLAALKELAPERARDALLARLGGADQRERTVAAAALGRLGDEGAIQPLLSVLNDQDELARRVAASSLALIGGTRALHALLQSYLDGDNRTRYPISIAIASFGGAAAQQALAHLVASGRAPQAVPVADSGRANPNLP